MFLKCKNRLADLKLPFGKHNSFTTYSPTWSKLKFNNNITEKGHFSEEISRCLAKKCHFMTSESPCLTVSELKNFKKHLYLLIYTNFVQGKNKCSGGK